jgi:hypothetical protein
MVSKDKPSSFLGLVISDNEKKFYNIDHRWKRCQTAFFIADADGKKASAFVIGKNVQPGPNFTILFTPVIYDY